MEILENNTSCGVSTVESELDDESSVEAVSRANHEEEDANVTFLRKFRTQQALQNMLLEREVKILQVRA